MSSSKTTGSSEQAKAEADAKAKAAAEKAEADAKASTFDRDQLKIPPGMSEDRVQYVLATAREAGITTQAGVQVFLNRESERPYTAPPLTRGLPAMPMVRLTRQDRTLPVFPQWDAQGNLTYSCGLFKRGAVVPWTLPLENLPDDCELIDGELAERLEELGDNPTRAQVDALLGPVSGAPTLGIEDLPTGPLKPKKQAAI